MERQHNSKNDDYTNHPRSPQHVLIAGSGIVGLSTAYYLTKLDSNLKITIIDPSGEIAPAASGKAGGFLALDWNDGSPTESLTHRSFMLHQELANELNDHHIDYRRASCAAISVQNDDDGGGPSSRPSGQKLMNVEWAQSNDEDHNTVVGMRMLGNEETIAQVHPKKLCNHLWQAIQATGNAQLVAGTVTGPRYKNDADNNDDDNGQESSLIGAQLSNGTLIEGDVLLFACGPWTANIVTGVKYHSVVVPTDTVLRQCVFFHGCGDPEVYVRPDATAYCTGFPQSERIVTERPGQETVVEEQVQRIITSVQRACGQTNDNNDNSKVRPALQMTNPIIKQACYLPTTPDNLPIMGALPTHMAGGPGCFIATGHGCWGILLGPATGECMAHIILTGQTATTPHVDLRYFSPTRFRGTFQLVPNAAE